MKKPRLLRLAMKTAALYLFSAIFFGCRPSDSTLQQRLVGTWKYAESVGMSNQVQTAGNLTFTVTPDAGYISRIISPEPHSLKGSAKIDHGSLIVTITNRDNAGLPNPIVSRETIIRFKDRELVTQSEGSTVQNIFRKDSP